LSDIRLNTVTEDDYSNLFSPRYDFYHNSTSSRRGVGILISNSLQYSVSKKYCDENNNILGIKMVTNNVSILLIGVYGPNQNEEKFFRDFKKIIMENSDSYIVSAGDWNLTYSSDPTADNIDIINMNAPPSIFRTELLLKICDEYGLSDPY
jgi:exonuclease III